jgi:hypothetical protein
MDELLSIEDLKAQSRADLQTILQQKVFYKYVSMAVTENYILPDHTLRFSPREFFNDPFDCNEGLLDVHIDAAWVREFAKDDLAKLSPALQEHMIQKMLNPASYRAALQKEKINFKICCFSSKPDDILMWSHYADKHAGICLGFQFPYRGEVFSMYPVRYIDRIRKLHGMADTAAIFNYWLTRKPVCWAYENEMRAVSRSGLDYIGFQQEQLNEVIFGCKVQSEQIDQVIAQTKKLGYKGIVFKGMEIDPSTFLLKSVQL